MRLSDLKKISNSDWINVEAEIIKAYLEQKDFVYICRSWMDDAYAEKLKADGYTVVYDQYKGRYEVSGWSEWDD